MLSEKSKQVVAKAKTLYETDYRQLLEASHYGEFVCIEPESREYFLGRTF